MAVPTTSERGKQNVQKELPPLAAGDNLGSWTIVK